MATSTRLSAFLAVAVGTLLLQGTPAFGQGKEPIALVLDANGSVDAALYRGWPLLIQAAVLGMGETPVEIATTGPWTASVKVTVLDGAGAPAPWPLRPLGAEAPPSFRLAWMEQVGAVWALAPEQTRTLAPGSCLVQAELDTTRTATAKGWRGVARSRSIAVRVADAPATLSEEDLLWKALLEARYQALLGDSRSALATLEVELARKPGSAAALSQKADLLEEMGRPEDALAALNEIIEGIEVRNPEADHPPLELLRRRRALLARHPDRLFLPGAPRPAPPAPSGTSGPVEPARPPEKKSEPPKPAPPPAADLKAKALTDYEDALRKGDALMQAGDYFEAVRVFEQAWRIRYNNKLDVPVADLDERLARARKARDENKKR